MGSPLQVNKLFSLTGHKDAIYALERGWTPDLFFSSGADGMIVQWNLKEPGKGKLIAKVKNSVYALRFDEPDSRLYIGHNFDGLHAIDPINNKICGKTSLGNVSIFDIAVNDQNLFVACSDGSIKVLDKASLNIIHSIKLSDSNCRSLALNTETGELAVGCSDNSIYIIDTSSFSIKQTIRGHQGSVFGLQFTQNGHRLFSASRDAKIKVWEASTEYDNTETIDAHMYAVNHLALNPNERLLASCSMDKAIRVWDASNYRLLKVIDKSRMAGHGTSVNKLLWATHENILISASDDRTISVWEFTRNTPES